MDFPVKTLAAVAARPRVTELREIPVPEIASDAGLMRVDAAGICGSDWPMYLMPLPGPRILGHEMIGTIVKLGDIARARWGLTEGDVVALEEYLPCGHCEYCRSGEYRSCIETDTQFSGAIRYGSTPLTVSPGLWGGYSQYLYLHPRSVFHRVPAGIPLRVASMALPIGNGFQWAVLDGRIGPGQTIVIQGPGQQGLGCVVAAASAGAGTIILAGLRKDEDRLAIGKELGAHHVVASDEEPLESAVSRITGGRMADVVIECSGASREIINASIRMTRKRGTIIVATRGGAVSNFDLDLLVARQIQLRGVRGHSYQAVELALQTMEAGRIPLAKMSSHVIGLSDLDEGLRMVGGKGREPSVHITVDPWKD